MSESETLISMVNRMVESSSPRAQLFMQVRPLPAAGMVPVNAISAVCAWLGHPMWGEARFTQSIHLPGLISPETDSAQSSPQLHHATSILHVHG